MGGPARLQVEIRTPHGAPVSGAVARVSRDGEELTGVEIADGLIRLDLPEPGDYLLSASGPSDPSGFELREHRAPLSFRPDADGVHRVEVTLEYRWFTGIGYPPTLGNHVEVLVDGEASWASVAEALTSATRSVHLTTWIYQPTAELLRPDPLAPPEAREPYTAQRLLEERARAGATVRFLLWDAPVLRLPEELRRAAEDGGDRFQVLEEPNPTRLPLLGEAWRVTNEILGRFAIGSYHQKTAVIDGRIGFCGGMNIKENDWDTREHRVFDARRCAFSRPTEARALVAERVARPDHAPRHDFMVRVEGPAVAHLEENFRERWNRLLAERPGADPAATPVGAPPPPPPAGRAQVQIVRTMPGEQGERGILDVYLRAVREARRLIYIEDQYFRSTWVRDAIAEALRASPDLEVIVLTAERQARDLLAGGWAFECFSRIQRERARFELYTLRVAARDESGRIVVEDVDNHAKLLIVDDRFLMVGSCNVNDRGLEVDGEINVAVADPELARQVRLDLFREHLGDDPRLTGEIGGDVAVWRERAEQSRGYDPEVAEELPASRVFPFTPPSRRFMLVGPHVV